MTLVKQQVLDDQVRDETYRQFEEAVAARDQATAMVSEMKSALDQSLADRDRARVDVEAARADLVVAQANEREAKVVVEYGRIKAPFKGVITQRNISPGDYLQPGGGNNKAVLCSCSSKSARSAYSCRCSQKQATYRLVLRPRYRRHPAQGDSGANHD